MLIRQFFFCIIPWMMLISSCSIGMHRYSHEHYISRKISEGGELKNQSSFAAGAPEVIINQSPVSIVSEPDHLNHNLNEEIIEAKMRNDTDSVSSLQVKDTTIKCDNIILKSGEELFGNVTEVSEKEIRYKKCEMLSGPDYVIDKGSVFIIKYVNGTKDVFKEEEKPNERRPKRTPEYYAQKAPAVGLVGIFLMPYVFGPMAIIYGIKGLKVTDERLRLSAILGIVLGSLSVLVIAAIIYSALGGF